MQSNHYDSYHSRKPKTQPSKLLSSDIFVPPGTRASAYGSDGRFDLRKREVLGPVLIPASDSRQSSNEYRDDQEYWQNENAVYHHILSPKLLKEFWNALIDEGREEDVRKMAWQIALSQMHFQNRLCPIAQMASVLDQSYGKIRESMTFMATLPDIFPLALGEQFQDMAQKILSNAENVLFHGNSLVHMTSFICGQNTGITESQYKIFLKSFAPLRACLPTAQTAFDHAQESIRSTTRAVNVYQVTQQDFLKLHPNARCTRKALLALEKALSPIPHWVRQIQIALSADTVSMHPCLQEQVLSGMVRSDKTEKQTELCLPAFSQQDDCIRGLVAQMYIWMPGNLVIGPPKAERQIAPSHGFDRELAAAQSIINLNRSAALHRKIFRYTQGKAPLSPEIMENICRQMRLLALLPVRRPEWIRGDTGWVMVKGT